MILVDTSVWIRHFRNTERTLFELLDDNAVLTHPIVIGELACGNLPRRPEILGTLLEMPTSPRASDEEALAFIERHRLMGLGIGYNDVHLLASALLAGDTRVWTVDARLQRAAARLFVSYNP